MPARKKAASEAITTVSARQHFSELEDREDLKAARASLREVKRKGTIPWTRIKEELGLN